MRLATITNWAYGATLVLTLASGTTMLLASGAQDQERAAVAQRYALDKATSSVDDDIFRLTEQARQFVLSGDPAHLLAYRRELGGLEAVETRERRVGNGITPSERVYLRTALRLADELHDEQAAGIDAREQGNEIKAHQLVFGAEYARQVDQIENAIERFQDSVDQRTQAEVRSATGIAQLWRTSSEIVLALTGLLFLCVLYFVFKQRVLRPVVRLSDVVTRLAAQDYAVETPAYDQIDEIGDMAQAIRVFRENGIERQRLEAEKASDRAMRDLIARMTSRMQGCDAIDELKDVVARFMPELLPQLAGSLYLLDRAHNRVATMCSWSLPQQSQPTFSPMACWALRRGATHRPVGLTIDVPCDHVHAGAHDCVDTICVPLTAQRQTLGLLYLEPRDGGTIPAWAEVYLSMVSENIGLALNNLLLRETLQDMAMADALTGLANRRRLEAVLAVESAAAEREQRPLGCLVIDVDHFKKFNDRFGHDAGDAVLREVGQVLRRCTREDGVAFRYGGEEFVLLLPGMAVEQACDRAEQVRRAIARLRVRFEDGELGPVSVSIGVSSAPEHGAPERLIAAADAALLRAKEAGRDRVVAAMIRAIRDAA
jgi:diguanylate cyclase (GGDEF)-like protein